MALWHGWYCTWVYRRVSLVFWYEVVEYMDTVYACASVPSRPSSHGTGHGPVAVSTPACDGVVRATLGSPLRKPPFCKYMVSFKGDPQRMWNPDPSGPTVRRTALSSLTHIGVKEQN